MKTTTDIRCTMAHPVFGSCIVTTPHGGMDPDRPHRYISVGSSISLKGETDMTHEHTWQTKPNAIEACACGAARVVASAATVARRDAATIAFKRRVNETYARMAR